MIRGIGIDLVEVDRLRGVLERHPRLLHRMFTQQEQIDAGSGPERFLRLAARMAAKEAYLKALGQGFRGGRWVDMEVYRLPSGQPCLRGQGVFTHEGPVHLSLSHSGNVAIASVVIER